MIRNNFQYLIFLEGGVNNERDQNREFLPMTLCVFLKERTKNEVKLRFLIYPARALQAKILASSLIFVD